MRHAVAVCGLLAFFSCAALAAQEAPATVTQKKQKAEDFASPELKAPALTELEAARVEVSLQNETIVRLKIQLAELQKQYDVLQLTLDRQQRTPPSKDGFIWSWERNADGQIKGYVKPEKDTTK